MKNISPTSAAYLRVLAVLLLIGGYGYFKFWNIAVVNGKGISRIAYYQALENAGGKQTLDQMIQENLVLAEGAKNNITLDKAGMDAEIKKVTERLKTQGQTLDSALKMSGMTMADLEKQILMQRIQTTLSAPKTEITQAQIDQFIKTYKDQLPAKGTKAELETIARDELTAQAKKTAASDWVTNLVKNAKVELK